jgi:hypothetical protein
MSLFHKAHLETPPSHNPSTLSLGRFKPSKVYQRRPPHKSLVVKTLFQGFLPLNTMAHTWSSNLFKPLNLENFVGYPNAMPKEIHKWLPKFTRNDVVTPEDHLYTIGVALLNEGVEHKDIAMRILVMSLTEDDQRWFRVLVVEPDYLPDSEVLAFSRVYTP